MTNMDTKNSTIKSVVGSAAFAKGYREAHRGLPMVEVGDTRQQWNYERGRLFAACFKGTLKINNRIRVEAMYEFADAWNSGSII